jgi:hypothetical protein
VSRTSRHTFVVAFRFTAFCVSDAETAGIAASWRSRASAADFARAALVAEWPTRRLSA